MVKETNNWKRCSWHPKLRYGYQVKSGYGTFILIKIYLLFHAIQSDWLSPCIQNSSLPFLSASVQRDLWEITNIVMPSNSWSHHRGARFRAVLLLGNKVVCELHFGISEIRHPPHGFVHWFGNSEHSLVNSVQNMVISIVSSYVKSAYAEMIYFSCLTILIVVSIAFLSSLKIFFFLNQF